ncbi:MAG: NTP transferase domain-containing protein [Actinomycetia bacterium]|nr:NTP transferase domain-containing protein [Actinomycetes bacterium]
MSNRSMSGLVVATSSGAPMRSARPKPIHLLCGRAMASYVLDTLAAVGVRQGVVVTGPEGGRISKRLLEDPPGFPVRFVEQKIDRGTGDAVLGGLSGFDDFNDDEDVLIVPAELPLLRPAMIEQMLLAHAATRAACTVLTVKGSADDGAGRIVRDRHGSISAISSDGLAADDIFDKSRLGRRHRPSMAGDASEADQEQTPPAEIATGVFCIRRGLLAPAIRRTAADNPAGAFHLSDVVEVLASSGHACESALVDSAQDLIPVGNRHQLAEAEAELRRRTNHYWLSMGVTMVDPDRTYIDATVTLGTDVTIFPGTILQGATTIGDGCELGPDARLDRCEVGKGTKIEKVTATLAKIGDDCTVGPFAVLAPGVHVVSGTATGPFYAGS